MLNLQIYFSLVTINSRCAVYKAEANVPYASRPLLDQNCCFALNSCQLCNEIKIYIKS